MAKPTADQVKFYEENGYLKLGRILTDDELAEARAAADKQIANPTGEIVFEKEVDPPLVRRVSKVIQRDEVFRKVATHPIVIENLTAIIGSPIEVCLNRHNMLMVKAPFQGGQFDWHQDAGSWQCQKLISLMVMLDDATIENGCLQVLPRIFRDPEWHNPDYFMDLSIEKYKEAVKNPVPIECKAGEGFVFHCLTPHMSAPNKSANFRRSLNFAYAANRDRDLVAKPYALDSFTVHGV